jgi:hypothetical protein
MSLALHPRSTKEITVYNDSSNDNQALPSRDGMLDEILIYLRENDNKLPAEWVTDPVKLLLRLVEYEARLARGA